MSQAFVKEGDAMWLHDVAPTATALFAYLSAENNGIRVYELRRSFGAKDGREIIHASNGLDYAKDKDGRWEIVW